MKRITLILFIILGSYLTHAIQPPIELALPNSNKIVVKLMFSNGSIADPQGKEGLTNLTATLIAEGGTGDFTSSQLKDKTYPWAVDWGVSVDKEVSVFTFEFHKDHENVFLPILLGLITNPELSEMDFNRIKSNQLNYVNEVIRSSSDEEFSKMALEDYLFRGTKYQHMTSGTSSGLESITISDAVDHYKKVFTKNNLLVGMAGSYSASFKTKLLSGLEELSTSEYSPEDADLEQIQVNGLSMEIISKNNALGSAIFMGSPLSITRSSDDFAALMVANSWLGEHRKSYSKLYQKIRQERSMNYGDYSYIEWYQNGGSNMLPLPGYPRSVNYFAIWIRPVQTAEGLKSQYKELDNLEVGHAPFAIKMAFSQLEKLIEEGLSPEDFELTRNFLRSYMKLYIQTPGRQLGYLMDSKYYGRRDYIKEMDKLLANVTLEQVNEVVRKFLNPNNMKICIVTDDSEAEPLLNVFQTGSNADMSYSNDLKESLTPEILDEDEQINNKTFQIEDVTIVSSNDLFR